MKDLDGEHTIEERVSRFVYGPHTTTPKLFENLVMRERLAHHLEITPAKHILTQLTGKPLIRPPHGQLW